MDEELAVVGEGEGAVGAEAVGVGLEAGGGVVEDEVAVVLDDECGGFVGELAVGGEGVSGGEDVALVGEGWRGEEREEEEGEEERWYKLHCCWELFG